jgi:hypothetical protein
MGCSKSLANMCRLNWVVNRTCEELMNVGKTTEISNKSPAIKKISSNQQTSADITGNQQIKMGLAWNVRSLCQPPENSSCNTWLSASWSTRWHGWLKGDILRIG